MGIVNNTYTTPDLELIENGTTPYNGSYVNSQGTGWTSSSKLRHDFGINLSYDETAIDPTATHDYCIFNAKMNGDRISDNHNNFIGIAIPRKTSVAIALNPGTYTWSVGRPFYKFNTTQQKFVLDQTGGVVPPTYGEGSLEYDGSTFTANGIGSRTITYGGLDMDIYYVSAYAYGYFAPGANVKYEMSGTGTSFYNETNFKKALYDYLTEAVPVPEFTGKYDIYSTYDGMFTLVAHDFINPPGGYMSGYYKFYNTAVQGQPGEAVKIPYTSVTDQQVSWNELYNSLGDSDQQQYVEEHSGQIPVLVGVGHNEGSSFTPDLVVQVTVKEDGTMSKIDLSQNLVTVLHPHEDPGDNDTFDSDDALNDPQVPGQEMSVDNLLTTSYVCTVAGIQRFGRYIWTNALISSDIYAMQTAPIENVLSCKRIPFEVTGDNAEIVLGNLHTGVGIDVGTQQYDGTVKKAEADHKQPIGTITIPTYHSATHGSWLDMRSNISIYLPYCGIHTIPTGLCYKQEKDADGNPYLTGRELKVEYYYDIVYGTCCANLYLDDILYASINGECGVDIPITSSNRAANELGLMKTGMNAVTGTVSQIIPNMTNGAMAGGGIGALAGVAAGLIGGAFSGYANVKAQSMTMDTHYTTTGGFSSQIASYMTKTVTLFIDHVKYKRPSTYAHDNGFPCNLSRYLSKLKGYTEIDGACEIQNIPCFEAERRAIKEALMQGFYL